MSKTLRHWYRSVSDFYGGGEVSIGHFDTIAKMSWVRSVHGYTSTCTGYTRYIIQILSVPPSPTWRRVMSMTSVTSLHLIIAEFSICFMNLPPLTPASIWLYGHFSPINMRQHLVES